MGGAGIPSNLPFVDEHSVDVSAPPQRTWNALVRTSERTFGGSARSAFARLLGCESWERAGEPAAEGSTVVGFRVARSEPPNVLTLEGRHRFSRYRLAFEIVPFGGGSRLKAITHAVFPGLAGQAYRTLVIGTKGHVVATTSILRAVKRRAEHG